MVHNFDEPHFEKKMGVGQPNIYSLSKNKELTKSEANWPCRSETSTCLRHHILTRCHHMMLGEQTGPPLAFKAPCL